MNDVAFENPNRVSDVSRDYFLKNEKMWNKNSPSNELYETVMARIAKSPDEFHHQQTMLSIVKAMYDDHHENGMGSADVWRKEKTFKEAVYESQFESDYVSFHLISLFKNIFKHINHGYAFPWPRVGESGYVEHGLERLLTECIYFIAKKMGLTESAETAV